MDYLTPKDLLNLSSVNKSYRHLANNYSRQRQQELVNKSGITGLNSETNINGNYIITMIILKRSIDFLKRNNINDFSSPAVTLNAFRLLYSPPTLNPFRLASNRPTHIIRDFIKLGVGVNVTDERGCTALHYAAQYGHTTIVQHLIELGADVNLTDRYGWTPLHNAASNGHTTIVQHLIEHGANVNVTNGCGWTPLHYAARCGRANVVQHLIDRGADMNLEVNSNDTMFFAECLFNSLTPLDLTYDTMATIIHPFFILTIPISIYFDKNLLQRLRDTEQVLLNAGARSHGIHSHFKVHYICWSIFLATFIIRAIKKHT